MKSQKCDACGHPFCGMIQYQVFAYSLCAHCAAAWHYHREEVIRRIMLNEFVEWLKQAPQPGKVGE